MDAQTVPAFLLVFVAGLAASLPAGSHRSSPEPEIATRAILEANKGLHLYQGDIAGIDLDSRNAITDGQRWPNGVVPYVIGSEFSLACEDTHASCSSWASAGECTNSPGYMQANCPRSCGLCSARRSERTCQDNHEFCSHWAGIGECQINPNYMLNYCQLSCGQCQTGGDCSDNNDQCAHWASIGECSANPAYMLTNCQASCNSCGDSGGDNGGSTVTVDAGSEIGRIQAAMEEFNTRTCIRFVPRTNERNYVSIRKLTGCYSHVGVLGGAQELSLGTGCLGKATIIHELMHAAGFWHEHSRPDRDDYVKIYLQNAPQEQWHAFDKFPTSRTLGLSYDYGSIMHYESHAFSTNGRETIVPKRNLNGIVLGAAQDFSSLDLQKLNTLYDCNVGK